MGEPTRVSSGPGAAREGAARRGGSSRVRGRAGAASFKEAGTDRGGGSPGWPGALLHWNAPGAVRGAGMRRARGRAGGREVAIAHSPGADVG